MPDDPIVSPATPPDQEWIVTADTTAFSADETDWPTADGGTLVNLVAVAELAHDVEYVTADDTDYRADETIWPTADGGAFRVTADTIDAEIISAVVGFGGAPFPPRLRPAVGRGYGTLPELEGEAWGTVGAVADAAGTLPPLAGAATGGARAVAVAATALNFDAAAVVATGQIGRAEGSLGLGATAHGAQTAHGSAVGAIGIKGAANGQASDDDAVLAILLAA